MHPLSIRDAISELDRSEQLRLSAVECYLSCLRNLADYAIEIDETTTLNYQQSLKTLATDLEPATPKAFSDSRSTLRALLRDYRDKASVHFNQLREEFGRTAEALQRLVDSMTYSDVDCETRLRDALTTLRELSDKASIQSIGPALRVAVDTIEQSMDQFREQQKLTMAQFLGEITLLHKRIDALESAVSVDDLTKLLDRDELEERIAKAQNDGSLLLLKVQGVLRAEVQFSREIGKQLTAAFVKRLRNNLVPEAIVGCWSEEEFLVIHPTTGAGAQAASKWLTGQLSGAYACVQNGKTVRPSVQVSVAVVEYSPKEGSQAALKRVKQFFKK
jgi:GGDEF domain-containing protein